MGMFPVARQLGHVEFAPLLNEFGCRSRKVTADERAIVDTDQRFVLGVDRVEVRRVVVNEVHVDDDSVELAESGHAPNLRRATGLGDEDNPRLR